MLIEALAVIAILTLVIALAMPVIMRKPDHLILSETVQKIRQTLMLTRSRAIITGGETVFFIDLEKRRFGLQDISEDDMPQDLFASFKIADAERHSTAYGGIRFFPDGSSTGGELTFTLNDRTATLCVHWLFGRPVVAEKC